MDKERFERLVTEAVEGLPKEFRDSLENIDIVVEEFPGRAQLRSLGMGGRDTLLGLYEGVPLTHRGAHYGMVMPDKITIFQRPIEARSRSEAAVKKEVQDVIVHEIAHHFGISDARLGELKRKRKG
jgi:predicted Zn-dependent protease with MMP-like domain